MNLQIDSLSKEIECLMCLNTANDPRMCIHCSAIICAKCIENWINIKKICPKCSHSVELTDFIKCRLANRMVELVQGTKSNNSCNHSNTSLRINCSTCEQNICLDCFLINNKHVNHDYKYLDNDYEKILLINYKLIDFIRKRCKDYQEKINSIELDTQKLLNDHNAKMKLVNTDQTTVESWIKDTQYLFDDYQQKKFNYCDAIKIDELVLNDIEKRLKENTTLSDQEEILQILQKHIPSKVELNKNT